MLAVAVGATGFFAAIVFVGFLAALRAAGRWPAAFFFAAGLVTFFAMLLRAVLATRRWADFLTLDFAALARLRAMGLRARVLLAERFAEVRLVAVRFAAVRLADLFAADLFFAAISHLQEFREAIVSHRAGLLQRCPHSARQISIQCRRIQRDAIFPLHGTGFRINACAQKTFNVSPRAEIAIGYEVAEVHASFQPIVEQEP